MQLKESAKSIIKACIFGYATEEQYALYESNYMSKEEIIFGKPIFDMTPKEFVQYSALCQNMKKGNLPYGDCPKCRNKGYIVGVDEKGNEYCEDCDCVEQRRNMQRLDNSEYKELLRKCSFEKYLLKYEWQYEVLSLCKDWTKQNKYALLYLGGKTGAGKTMLGVSAFKVMVMRGYHGKFVSWRTSSRELKMNMNSPEYDAKINELKFVPLLLIDDFFWCSNGGIPTSEDFSLAKEILDARFYNNKKTIITSNFTPMDMYDLSEELSGRINEFSGGINNYCVEFKKSYSNYRYSPNITEIENNEDTPFD